MSESEGYWKRYWDRRIDRRRMLQGGAIGAAGALAAFYAACGGSANNKAPNTANSAATTGGAPGKTSTVTGGIAPVTGSVAAGGALAIPTLASTPIPLAAGVPGGKMNLALTLEPTTLDPLNAISGGDYPYGLAVYDTFINIHHFNTDPALSLTDKWEIIDPTHINFHIRPGVTFHDGSPFDAANYQWNMKRLQDPANKGVSLGQLSDIDHIDTPDPATAAMVLKQPNAAIFFAIGAYTASPVSRQAVEKSGDKFKSHPVGTGPFIFQEWVTGSHVTVKKNPNYWGKDVAGKALPYLDQITFTAIPDPNTQFANLQAGSVDFSGIGSLNLLNPA
ncbi:MAG: ABC transporter substrate-binding protein, partial [Dehalococcoidia bacterium]